LTDVNEIRQNERVEGVLKLRNLVLLC